MQNKAPGDAVASLDARIARCVRTLDAQRLELARQALRFRKPAQAVDAVRAGARTVGHHAGMVIAVVLPLMAWVLRRHRWVKLLQRSWSAMRLLRALVSTAREVRLASTSRR